MKTKKVNYGESHEVIVLSADEHVIACADQSINEGFVLLFHGMKVLPAVGDKGTIIFESDLKNGHWQYYPKTK